MSYLDKESILALGNIDPELKAVGPDRFVLLFQAC